MLYKHGAPPAMSALVALALENQREEIWQAYMAEIVWAMTRLWAKEPVMPRYSEIVPPRSRATDDRTAEEIKRDLVRQLRKGTDR